MTSPIPSPTFSMPTPSPTFSFPSTSEPVFSVSTSEPAFESQNYTQNSQNSQNSQTSQNTQSQQQFQQYHTTTVSNNNAKFPYLKKDEYETWAMKMEYWIMNSDHNLWNIVLNGNSRKKTGRDPKGNIMILPPVSVEEHIAVQRETKARTILLQSLPEDHMADFHHLDDARDIWLAVKARFGGNDESKKMRKSMLKQEFSEFRVSESEGLHKGYDRFQKILSQLNQMQAKPDNEDCNMKFLRALPPSWSQVAITLKTKGGLDYLSFDDLYNKLRTLEIDVKGGSSYDSRGTSAPTHSAFISAASTNSKMSYADSQNQSPSITFTTASSSADTSSNVIESVLHSFVAESDPQQQITYEDFDQIGKLDLEELDIKWQMAMLSVRINRFEKKAGRKMKFNNRDAARFDKKKVKCYKCSELGHFARECTGKQLDSKARYSAFKLKELDKSEEPKALLSVDSMLNWSDHEGEDEEKGAAQVYGMIAGDDDDAAGDASGDVSDAAAEFALMGLSSQVKLEESKARFDKWKESSKNLDKLINSSMSSRSKFGLVFGETFGSDEVFDPSAPSIFDTTPEDVEGKPLYDRFVKAVGMHAVPSNRFSSPKVHEASKMVESNSDYAEELARLQRQEHKVEDTAEKYGFGFSTDTEEPLRQADVVPAGRIDLAASIPAGHIDPAASNPAGSIDPATSNSAGSIDPAASISAGSAEPFPTVLEPVHADETSLPPGHLLGSSEHSTRFPSPSDLANSISSSSEMENIYHHPSTGIFSSSSYDADFGGTVTNLAPIVAVDPVSTKKVNTIHPQSQILRDLTSPVQTRGTLKNSVAQALNDSDWVEAIQEEMQQFINQKVWKLVPLPAGKIAIGTKWILKNKRDARGIVVRNKAKLVAQGHRQEEGIDYDEVFALVARIEAIGLFLAFASYMGFMVYQMDVKSSFLYGEIDEEVYVTQPKGFEDPHFPKHVYKVVKALYGLHQAPRAWYARLSNFLLKHNYRRGTIDKTLFIKKNSRDIILVQVYVDDIIFGSTKKAWCDEFEVLMKGEFEMSAMGELTFFLGLQVKQKPESLSARQVCPRHAKENLIWKGSLMYLTASRPDIMFAVSACSRHQVTPLTSNLNAIKKIFKKSTTGGLSVHRVVRLISWQCKKPKSIVATYSTEAGIGCSAKLLWSDTAIQVTRRVSLHSATNVDNTNVVTKRRKRTARKRAPPPLLDMDDQSFLKFDSGSESEGELVAWAKLAAWEVVSTPLGEVNALYRVDRFTKYFTHLREILHLVTRQDLIHLYHLVDKFYETNVATGVGLLLWGDLKVLFDSTEGGVGYSIWGGQQNWQIRSWRLYTFPHIHVLETMAGQVMYMFVDVPYPLSIKLMERMLKHKLELARDVVGNDLTTAEQLISFIKSQLVAAQASAS
ncbi:putative ribonuclease H-like domain-containing protein [Tanacetum coccineum]